MSSKAIIVDIDGTLADCEHRRHFVEKKPKDYESFFDAAGLDPLKPMAAKVVNSLYYLGYEIIYVTGRPERLRAVTRQWLQLHKLPIGKLSMRPDGDYTSDVRLKRTIYRKEIEPTRQVELVLDDRDSVVAMWRELGLECWQVAGGGF